MASNDLLRSRRRSVRPEGKTVAIIGYGSQGHAQAQNLRDSGVKVVVGQRPGGKNYDLAISHGFKPMSAAEATKRGRRHQHPRAGRAAGRPLQERNRAEPQARQRADVFARLQHPLRLRRTAQGVDALLVAPKGPGHLVRSEFVAGGGVPCLIAMSDGASRRNLQDRPGLRQGHRRHPRRRHSNHDRRRDRNRPVRRASRPLRRRERTGESRLRNARRSGLPARDGLLRMHARAEADRRPVLPGRPELHALQRQQHGRVSATTPAARGSSPPKPRRK